MPKKKKEAFPTSEIPVEPTDPKISEALQAKVQSIRAFAECHNVLTLGSYKAADFQTVAAALTFLRRCHTEAIEQASQDKGAWTVPELKDYLAAKKAAPVKNEETSHAES